MIPLLLTLLTLRWSPVTNAALYKVYQASERGYPTNAIATKGTNAVIPGAITGAVYFFNVVSVDTNGVESVFSAPFAVNLPPTNWAHVVAMFLRATNPAGPYASFLTQTNDSTNGSTYFYRSMMTIWQTNIAK